MILTSNAIEIDNLSFAYKAGKPVLDIASFSLAKGERAFLYGPSGSGKTTLLGILAGILAPSSGRTIILDQDFGAMSSRARDHFRGAHMGYIFQMFNLIPYLNVRANICLPCQMIRERRARVVGDLGAAAETIAKGLGIGEVIDKPVTELSVGQQQRVAAARALMGAPEIIIADEPTSALDYDHRESFIRVLFEQAETTGSTILFVSHDRSLANLFSRQIGLHDLNRVTVNA